MTKFEKDIFRFVQNALNRTITQCAKAQKKLIKQDYALSSKKIRKLTKINRAQDKLEATLKSSKVKLSINNFKRRQTKRGVSVKIAKGKRVFFKGAFLGVRKGQSRSQEAKSSGFLAIKNPSEARGFQLSKSTIHSYTNNKTPRATSVYYVKTKEFSLIAIDKTKALQKQAHEIFKKELSKE